MSALLDLAVVVPTFDERANVATLVAKLDQALDGVAWEVIFVDDDSPDGTADAADPLGAAPARGLVEKAALFRAAHEALRLVDAGAEEADLSDGQLRVRVRAAEREQAWRAAKDQFSFLASIMDKNIGDATCDGIVVMGHNVTYADFALCSVL